MLLKNKNKRTSNLNLIQLLLLIDLTLQPAAKYNNCESEVNSSRSSRTKVKIWLFFLKYSR